MKEVADVAGTAAEILNPEPRRNQDVYADQIYAWHTVTSGRQENLGTIAAKHHVPVERIIDYKRVKITGSERYHDKPDKNEFSHPHDALQYLLSGAGEGRTVMRRHAVLPHLRPTMQNARLPGRMMHG